MASPALKIVAIGGGSGLSNLLRGLKRHTAEISAVVTVADDGGSSGRLRRDMGVIPPGDIRNCILALANTEPLMQRLFQYRFDEDDGEEISGHSFGNLFIAAMSRVTGSMEAAIRETSRVLAVEGQIHPSTLDDVTLHARMADGTIVHGESTIPKAAGPVEQVWLDPVDPEVNRDAASAIAEADIVTIGPGSLYTSMIPNLLVPGLRDALLTTAAKRMFIVNVATQHGETDGYDAADHYRAAHAHVGEDFVDFVLANNSHHSPLPSEWQTTPVFALPDTDFGTAELVVDAIADHTHPYRHDAQLLADLVLRVGARAAGHDYRATRARPRTTSGSAS